MVDLRKLILMIAITIIPMIAMADDNIKDSQFNPVNTGVNSLMIATDARGASMGDIGAATEPDANSQYWNPSKYAFAFNRGEVSLSYTPWMRSLVNDIFLTNLTGYYKPGRHDNQAVSMSLRYFSLGNLTLNSFTGAPDMTIHPYEMSVDAGYSLKLSRKYSMAIVLRYIYSDLGFADTYAGDMSTGASAFAGDISGYFATYPIIGRNECQWSWGWNISNIGTKVNYNHGADQAFLPTNLRLGTTFKYPVADRHNLALSVDFNKLLVPIKPRESDYDTSTLEGETRFAEALQKWEDMSSISAIFKSFSDAPGGFKEEMREIEYAIGAEYDYNNLFFLRTGYHHQSKYKGNNNYFGFGAGFSFNNILTLDVSYMVATGRLSPLDQTLRFTLTFNIETITRLFGRQ
ncbi:MAG: type IX secretion system outer membrane channel protein PorV [Bacteroidales bacterium]|nr:type IX secretion system outer membrane channel protein PorV [Bacteroidales bacterium]